MAVSLLVATPGIALSSTYTFKKAVPQLVVTENANPGGSGTNPGGTGGGSGSGGSSGGSSGNTGGSGSTTPPEVTPAKPRWSVSEVAFDGVAVGSSQTRTLTLFNDGGTSANWDSLASDSPDLTVSAAQCAAVAPGASCVVTLTYSPTSTNSLNASVSVGSSVLRVTGKGLQPAAVLSTGQLTFAPVELGTTSAKQSVLLTNPGNAPLSIAGLIPSSEFTADTSCENALGAGESCLINVAAKPTTPGPIVGAVSLQTGVGTQSVGLSAYGAVLLSAQLSTTPQGTSAAAGELGEVRIGHPVETDVFVSTGSSNIGALQVSGGLQGSGDFSVVSVQKVQKNGTLSPCGASVTGATFSLCSADELKGASESAYTGIGVKIRFSPSNEGTKTAALVVQHNGTNASPLTLNLTGTGKGEAIASLDKTSLTWDAANSATQVGDTSIQQAVLQNTGTSALSLTGLALQYGNRGFTLTNDCGATLAPNNSCTLSVTFAPTSTQEQSDSLTVTTNGGNLTLALRGTGLQGAAMLSATALPRFANTLVNAQSAPQSFSVTNVGTSALTLGVPVAVGEFDASTDCAASLAPQSSCNVSAVFRPSSGGEKTGRIDLTTGSTTQSVTLSGFGKVATTAGLSSTRTSLTTPTGAFGDVVVGSNGSTVVYVLPTSGNYDSVGVNAAITGAGSAAFKLVAASKTDLQASSASCGATVSNSTVLNCYGDSLYNASSVTKTAPTLTVQFAPTSEGEQTAMLQVSHTGVNSSPLSLALTGRGVQPKASFAPETGSAVDFGAATLDATKSQTFIFSNTGVVALSGLNVQVTGNAAFSKNSTLTTCGSTLAASSTCKVVVDFTPTSTVQVTANVSVSSSAVGSPHTLTLTGSGNPKTIQLNGEVRSWSDGTVASSCKAYRTPSGVYSYAGDVGDGLYAVQPAGQASTTVYCDMTSDGGGWTLVLKGVRKTVNGSTWGTQTGDFNTAQLTTPTYSGTSAKFSDAFINALKISGSVYKLEGASPYHSVPVRYASGACVYIHTLTTPGTFLTRSGCTSTFSDVSLTSSRRDFITDNADGTFGGISDNNSRTPVMTYTTARGTQGFTNPDAYVVGSGTAGYYTGSHGMYKTGGTTQFNGAGGDLRMWVR